MTTTAMIDLHVHSSRSVDGEVAPERLVADAAAAGIAWLAVADHNSVAGVDPALAAGARHGIQVIPAVELDCCWRGTDIHILGYGIDHHDRRFAEATAASLAGERAIAQERLEKIRDMGIRVDDRRLAERARDGIIIAELVAEIALADPANDGNPLLAPFRPGGPRADNPLVNFFWDYCSRGKPAFVERRYPDAAWAVELIASSGGVPVLAHPGQNFRGREEEALGLLEEGVRGLEAYAGYHDATMAEWWRRTALAAGCGYTCGSDFHGKTKPAISLGGHGCGPHQEAVAEWLASCGVLKR